MGKVKNSSKRTKTFTSTLKGETFRRRSVLSTFLSSAIQFRLDSQLVARLWHARPRDAFMVSSYKELFLTLFFLFHETYKQKPVSRRPLSSLGKLSGIPKDGAKRAAGAISGDVSQAHSTKFALLDHDLPVFVGWFYERDYYCPWET